MAALMVGVVILTAVGWLVNRAAGAPPCSCGRPRDEPDAGTAVDAGKRASDVVLGFAGRRPPYAAHGGYGSSRSRRRTRDGRVLGNGGRGPLGGRRGAKCGGGRGGGFVVLPPTTPLRA